MGTHPHILSRPPSLESRGIAHVGLKVSDIEKSRRFYREILGFKDELRQPGVVYLPSGPDRLVVYDEHSGTSDFHFGFKVDTLQQVKEWRDWLRSKDVTILEDMTEDKHQSIKFKDPDGHWIEISSEK